MRLSLLAFYIVITVGWTTQATAQLADLSPPKTPFKQMAQTPPPDYRQSSSWAVRPGVASAADKVPNGAEPGRASAPDVDVFFIHPTTFLGNHSWNARFDADGFTGQQLNEVVLGYQVSAFNVRNPVQGGHRLRWKADTRMVIADTW